MAVPRKHRQLIPGENPAITDFDGARRWLTIYEQREALLAHSSHSADYESIAAGVRFWRGRVAELSGLSLDSDRRVIAIDAEHEVPLTPRELQLLEFLVQHPHLYFPDHVLAVRAWGDRLSGDQVRIYVRRLRMKLAETGWQVVSRRGRGYALERLSHEAPGHLAAEPGYAHRVQRALVRSRTLLTLQRELFNVAMDAAEQLASTDQLRERLMQVTNGDESAFHRFQAELERWTRDVKTAYTDLQSSNEELQSLLEELQTTNLTLQSSKEMLETANGELASGNSALQTVYSDLRRRSEEVDRLSGFMEAILTCLRVGVVVVDASGLVTLWDAMSEQLWGLRATEAVARPFVDLDLGLPMAEVGQMVDLGRRPDASLEERVFSTMNRQGRRLRCKVLVIPLASLSEAASGAIVVMAEVEG